MKHTSHTRTVRILSGLLYFFSVFMLIALPGHLHSQWIPQSIPVNKPITALEFIDSLKGWAVTDWGNEQDTSYILNTTNGGKDWFVQFKVSNYTFYSLDMVDEMFGYISGVGGGGGFTLFLKTTNAGVNWFGMNVPMLGLGFDDIFFINKDSGYVCTESSIFWGVWRTTNGGLNFERKSNGITNGQSRKLFFLNYSTGYCGASFEVYKTTNAGENWFGLFGFANPVMSIFFLDSLKGWVGLTNNRLAHTINGGTNWSYQLPNFSVGSTTDLYFYDSLKGWGGSRLSRILKTTTSGNVWGYQTNSSASYTISFIDSSNGWTGDMGVSHTTNGGGIITHINSYTNFIPEDYKLYQNYPNPFNSQTKISFEVRSNSFVKLIIYDIAGREINIWQSKGILSSGRHEFLFDAGALSSGVYFYKIEVSTESGNTLFIGSKKMMLVK